MAAVIVGSRQWCNEWAQFYAKQAIKFSRMKYEGDEQMMYYALLSEQFWLHCDTWGG